MAALLHCETLVMLQELQAYFDETGTHGDSRVTAIAGYVGTVAEWTHVENQWQEILEPYAPLGLTWWHHKDYPGQRGQFERIGSETSNLILGALTNVINESDLQVIWAGVDAEAFAALLAEKWRGAFKPYDFCFYWIMRQLSLWSEKCRYTGRTGMVFAVQDEYNGRSARALESWHSGGVLQHLGPIGFDYPKFLPALQPADILANEMYRLLEREKTENHSAPSLLLQRISKSRLQEGGFATEETIRHYMTDPHDAWANPQFREIS
jgi:hypothetical protein